MKELLAYGFKTEENPVTADLDIKGVFFESSVGERLKRIEKLG